MLSSVGSEETGENCNVVNLDSSDYLKILKITYDSQGVSSVSITTKLDVTIIFGSKTLTEDSYTFSSATQFVGLYGGFLSTTSISDLGAIIYYPRCGNEAATAAAAETTTSET